VADKRLLIAVALGLAGCGGKAAAPPPAPPVGNQAEPDASNEPDERACRIAMLGELVDAPVDDLQVVVPRPGEAFGVCLIITSDAETERAVLEVSPIARDGDGWKITESSSFPFDKRDTEEGSAGGGATIELFPLSPTEHGLRQEVVLDSSGPEWGERHVYTTILRILPDRTTEPVLELSSVSSTGEADDVWERVLTRLDSVTGGFYDLEVAVSHRSAQWAAGASGYDEESWTERWTWGGAAYELAETISDD
jgi:hypothetical protein